MARPVRPNLFQSLNLDAPHITEVRRLLQALLRNDREAARRIYMVTSARRGEGKSTTCALLAIVAAKLFHKRTLVIDADVRAATMHHLLGISRGPGFSEVLQGRVTLDAAIRATPLTQLFAMPIGAPIGRASEAYDDDACQALLQKIRSDFELIFIDAAPVVPVVEPMMIAEHVDGILVVAMVGRTPLTLIRRMKQIIEPAASKISGIILSNAVDGLPYYYDYRYYGYERAAARRTGPASAPREEKRVQPKSSAA
ncbi:MAG: CpsD/CapB family tyrosine-protein kinase [Candidatus Latescibacteria bacterium]|nr:CpsD/CapB family tyrosine-protein kinase [Candidatus Latescibacterota bacterium]